MIDELKKVKIIEVTTATCGICKSLAPVIAKMVELLADKADFEKQEVDFDAEIVKEHNIKQVPTFLFFDGDKLLDKHSGSISIPEFTKKVTVLYNQINEQ